MPTLSLPASTIPRFGPEFFQPQVIGHDPTAGLKNRLLMAQIRKEEAEPGLQEREFRERMREFNVGEAGRTRAATEEERYHRGEEAYRGEELGFRREALAQQLQEAREAHEAQVLDTLTRTAPSLGLGPDVLSDVLNRAGYPQLAQSMTATAAKRSEAEYQQRFAAYRGAKPDVREKLLRGADEPTQRRLRSDLARTTQEALPTAPPEGPAPWETDTTAETIPGFGYPFNIPKPTGVPGFTGYSPIGSFSDLPGRIGGFFNTKEQESAARKKRGSELSVMPP